MTTINDIKNARANYTLFDIESNGKRVTIEYAGAYYYAVSGYNKIAYKGAQALAERYENGRVIVSETFAK